VNWKRGYIFAAEIVPKRFFNIKIFINMDIQETKNFITQISEIFENYEIGVISYSEMNNQILSECSLFILENLQVKEILLKSN